MAANTGVTLAKIRAGTASFKEDSATFSEEIKAVQKALKLMGFWGRSGAPDGKYEEYSVAAVRGFQSENNLPITGIMNKATLAKLESLFSFQLYAGHSKTPSVLAIATGFDYADQGTSGSAVTYIRTQLNKKGYKVAATGSFDADLAAVVKKFQADNGLSTVGRVGQQTYCVLSVAATATNWFSGGKANLNPAHLAKCGFSGVMLNRGISELNSALSTFGINTKEKVKHFLAQCMVETVTGTQVLEYGYRAGKGKVSGVSYSPYYGSGYLHLTWSDAYEKFHNYMKSKGTNDPKIFSPADYATQHVAINYPGRSAGWFWAEYKKINGINWNASAQDICAEVTKRVFSSKASPAAIAKRFEYYKQISAVLK